MSFNITQCAHMVETTTATTWECERCGEEFTSETEYSGLPEDEDYEDEMVEQAADDGLDVAFDAFAYTVGNSTINVVFPDWFLDNFEDKVNPKTLTIEDDDVNEALIALLTSEPHAVKVIISPRIAPKNPLLFPLKTVCF